MNTIISELGKSQRINEIIKNIENKISPIEISGLTDVAETAVITSVNEYAKRPIMIITYNEIQAKKIADDLKYFTDKVCLFPKKEIITYDYIAESKDLPYERIEVLNKIYDNKNMIIVTTIEAVQQKIVAKEELYKNVLDFKIGQRWKIEEIKQKLVDLGYVRYELIDGRGEFSVRGGIIDISISETTGVRIELWGDEIDSIRYFNIISQRSTSQIDKIKIFPAHEYILENSVEDVCNNLKEKIYEGKRLETLENDIEVIRNGDYLSKIDRYFNSFYKNQNTILDYLSEKYLIFIDEKSKLKARSESIRQDTENLEKSLIEKEKIIPDSLQNTLEYNNVEDLLKDKQTIFIEKLNNTTTSNMQKYNLHFRQLNYFKSETGLLIEDIKRLKKQNKKIYILVDMKEKAGKIEKILQENEIDSRFEEKLNQTVIGQNNNIVITVGKLSNGYESDDINQVIIVADELVSAENRNRKFKREEFKKGEKVVFADLKVGDYVVHRSYGIGIYIGVNTITADKTTKDYIKIKYLEDDILYVPINALDSVRKYVGGEEIGLKLNKLGSKDWQKTTNKVKNNLRTVAKELIELYARREKARGYAFSPDTDWQREFEGKFPYIETDDQLRCIHEVKVDMENEKPMDRLLCGDVGYGKTEVALRAAFKEVQESRQVAYLAPTTILAQQIYNTFVQRMKEFPVRVELLCRFRTPAQQKKAIEDLKKGQVDVVIGTHRILSKDVKFKNLGLLIVDEEQRFGVTHKERIKQLKKDVDVLTLTATPIPRTLHMSLIGIRDMSVLEEPPMDRMPIQTYVMEYDEETVREAINRELRRGGQVYYVYNRVTDIADVALRIAKLVPEARVDFAHGQMSERELENVMYGFVNGDIDVLVSTTIIETGLDISNVNTMIIHDSDRYGLSQLYQLRGRIGRSNRTAYAFLMYRKNMMLKETAEKRLAAIREYTDLGSGFKIAMRDLELRGAGNLLGAQQHGHMNAVGYDLYCKMLSEAVKEAKGIHTMEDFDTSIDLNVDAYIPDTYIGNEFQKLDIYKRIAGIENQQDYDDMLEELLDRFGEPGKAVLNLLAVARLKSIAHRGYVTEIKQLGKEVRITLYERAKLNPAGIPLLMQKYGRSLQFKNDQEPKFILNLRDPLIQALTEFAGELEKLAE